MRILIIEDDKAIADFLGQGLTQEGFSCKTCFDGRKGLQSVQSSDFDCIVLDLMLPELDGLSLLKQLRGQGYRTPVIVLSAKVEVDSRLECFEAGADDYLVKPFSFAELHARILALLRRSMGQQRMNNYVSTGNESDGAQSPGGTAARQVLVCGHIELDRLAHTVKVQGKPVDLPRREFALLEYLMRNSGNVVSKAMILEHIWDYHFDPQTNVVDVLVHRLRSKVDPEHQLIHTLRGSGYVIKEHSQTN